MKGKAGKQVSKLGEAPQYFRGMVMWHGGRILAVA